MHIQCGVVVGVILFFILYLFQVLGAMGAARRLGDGRVAVKYIGAVERKRVERHGSSGVWGTSMV